MSSPEAEGMIAKPENGNLGCVVNAANIDISVDALELLKKVKKGKGGLGDIDVFKADEGLIIFGWLGGYLNAFLPKDILASRDYSPELLNAIEGVEADQDFMNYIDSL